MRALAQHGATIAASTNFDRTSGPVSPDLAGSADLPGPTETRPQEGAEGGSWRDSTPGALVGVAVALQLRQALLYGVKPTGHVRERGRSISMRGRQVSWMATRSIYGSGIGT